MSSIKERAGYAFLDRLLGWKPIRFIKGNFTSLELVELFFLMTIGLVVFTWYSSNLIINTFDYNFSFSPERTLERSLSLWDPYGGIGLASPRSIAGAMPNNLYFAAMHSIGLSLHDEQTLLFYVILVGSGVSMFLLYRSLDFGERFRKGAIFAATLYMFSPIASTFLWNQFTSNYYSYCFIPLIAAMVIFGIRTKRGALYILSVVLIWTVLLSSSYMNPVNALMDWLFVLGLVLVFVYKDSGRKRQIIKFAVILMFLWLLINLVWILPILGNASEEYMKANVSKVGISNLELLKSNSVPYYGAVIQTGYWALYGIAYSGDHWFSWWELASSVIFLISCTVIAITAWYAFFIRPRNPVIILLGGFVAMSLIMINGYYPPTGNLLVGLFEQFPSLYAFRSLYQRFGPLLALCYSLLFGYAMAKILGGLAWPKFRSFSIQKISKKMWVVMIWTVLVLLSLSVVAIPYFSGQIIYDGGKVIPSARVQVPEYYYQANDYLNNASGDFRVFALPYCQLGYAVYSWENGYWGADPSSSIFDRVVITSEYGEVNELLVDIANKVANDSLDYNLGKMLSIFNVRYIILHEDANWAFISGQDHPWWAAPGANFTMYDTGLRNAGMQAVATFGELYIYENPSWRDVQFVQVNQTLAVVGGMPAVKNLTNENWYDVSKMAFVSVPSTSAIGLLPFPVDAVYLNNTLITKASWKIQDGVALSDSGSSSTVHKLELNSGQRILVFSDRYDPGWTMTSDNGTAEHFTVNMFFNGWLSGNSSTKATVEYQPQKEVTYLAYFSILIALGTFIYLFGRHLRLMSRLKKV
jgi:hypothetical protein